MNPKIILTGQRFGRLLVVSEHGRKYDGCVTWLCKCDCGNERIVSGHSLRAGSTRSCGCLSREHGRTMGGNLRLSYGIAAMNKKISETKLAARRRNLEWALTDEQVIALFTKNCHYCGTPPAQICKSENKTGDYVYNGIDRVDNNRGYVVDNVVPCCIICNRAKREMPLSEFQNWIRRLSKHFAENNCRSTVAVPAVLVELTRVWDVPQSVYKPAVDVSSALKSRFFYKGVDYEPEAFL
jgi:hypothetical protein